MTKYVFITGGVVSSLGKGIAAASLGALLQARGYTVRICKMDPYLNIDPGTMSPTQHGEVFVTDDGAETDLDLGHYERFIGRPAIKTDSITTGRIYMNVLQRERRGEYLGATIQVIPHITDEIKAFIHEKDGSADFVLVETGGTVGDIEAHPYLEAIRQFSNEIGERRAIFIHATWLPYIPAAGELKTKPTQHSVKELMAAGIRPNILLCRADRHIEDGERRKISLFCNIPFERVIPALDVKSIYEVPLTYHAEGLDTEVLNCFGMQSIVAPDLSKWVDIVNRIKNPQCSVKIAIVGKYTELSDSYKSLNEALIHGGIANHAKVELKFIESEIFENGASLTELSDIHAILVPGGFGVRGTEGKIKAVQFAREQNIPYLGICFGMQMAVIEACRNLLNLTSASSTEFGETDEPVVGIMTEWVKDNQLIAIGNKADLGGTMRLGAYPAVLKKDSLVAGIYGTHNISERHRHRYEVNTKYIPMLEGRGFSFSGMSPDGNLPEIVEIKGHPWFVGVQFHPEFKSKPFAPHPLFVSFVRAAIDKKTSA